MRHSIAHLRFNGLAVIGILIFITCLIFGTLLFIPVAVVTQQLGVYGKLASLLPVYPAFVILFCTWLLSGYCRALPLERKERAVIDRCRGIGAMTRITLPLAAPGIVTAAIFGFTLTWHEPLYAVARVNGELNRTVAPGVVKG